MVCYAIRIRPLLHTKTQTAMERRSQCSQAMRVMPKIKYLLHAVDTCVVPTMGDEHRRRPTDDVGGGQPVKSSSQVRKGVCPTKIKIYFKSICRPHIFAQSFSHTTLYSSPTPSTCIAFERSCNRSDTHHTTTEYNLYPSRCLPLWTLSRPAHIRLKM